MRRSGTMFERRVLWRRILPFQGSAFQGSLGFRALSGFVDKTDAVAGATTLGVVVDTGACLKSSLI